MKVKLFQILRYYLNVFAKNRELSPQERMSNNSDFVKRSCLLKCLEYFDRKRLHQRDMDLMWAKMKARIEEEKAPSTGNIIMPKWRHRPFSLPKPMFAPLSLRYALVLMMIVCGSLILLKNRIVFKNSYRVQRMDYQTVKVDYGQRLNIELNDGTIIKADAGSEIQYPTTFSNRRDIYLKGEAYFEVAPDPERPFFVHANHALVQVIGTKFNVRAWSENPTVTVSVNAGKVALSPANGDKQISVILTKDEMSLLTPNSTPTKPQPVNAQDHLGWMKNEIKFDNASIEEVVAQLQRWYNYEFVIQDSSILKDRLTVHILPTNVKDVLEVISLLTNTKIEKESNCIRLVPKN